jgi:hypothetical protein
MNKSQGKSATRAERHVNKRKSLEDTLRGGAYDSGVLLEVPRGLPATRKKSKQNKKLALEEMDSDLATGPPHKRSRNAGHRTMTNPCAGASSGNASAISPNGANAKANTRRTRASTGGKAGATSPNGANAKASTALRDHKTHKSNRPTSASNLQNPSTNQQLEQMTDAEFQLLRNQACEEAREREEGPEGPGGKSDSERGDCMSLHHIAICLHH